MFVDASAFCTILNVEPEREAILETLLAAREVVISPIVVWECVRATVRHHEIVPTEAEIRVRWLMEQFAPARVVIAEEEERLALAAYVRFGKGRHPAQLNMGDCFAYACAKANGLPLLFKGNDFGQTDIDRVPWA